MLRSDTPATWTELCQTPLAPFTARTEPSDDFDHVVEENFYTPSGQLVVMG
ncbi:hypothetical protein ACF059_30555 [Streptomyces sp. NPDC016562]|uniref:hypothetical protein n=1 Tax=Streptomyces sp. NPDC016562 TaxID=3364966 RepID=UPI0036FA4769